MPFRNRDQGFAWRSLLINYYTGFENLDWLVQFQYTSWGIPL